MAWLFGPWILVCCYLMMLSVLGCATQVVQSVRKRELPAWHRDTLGSCLQTFFSAFFFLLFVSLELSHFHVQQE